MNRAKLLKLFLSGMAFLCFCVHSAEKFTPEVKDLNFSVKTSVPGFYFGGSLKKPLLLKKHGKIYDLTIPIKELTTELPLRDQHMREKVFQGKDIQFRGTSECPTEASCTLKGELEIAGKKKQVTLYLNKSGQYFHLKYKIKLSDFSIPPPEFAGVKVKDEISLTATVIE